MFGWFKNVPVVERRAAFISIGVGIALLVIKFIAYFLTGSAAIFSDAVESIVNVLASFVAAWSLGLAHMPPDAEHPYGHGKVEFMSAGFEGGMILLAAFVMCAKALDGLILHPVSVEELGFGLSLMVLAMLINGGVGLYLIRVGRRRSALSLEADGHHLMSDAITSLVATAALLAVKLSGRNWLDPACALLIAFYIGWMGIGLLRRSAAGLMDRQDVDDERVMKEILDSHSGPEGVEPRICGYHKLRHRHTGRYHWVDVHITVPPGLTVVQGHDIASAIEGEIERRLGEGDATAHIEPCPGCPACAPHAADPKPEQ